jgi:acetylornithine deacetylase/succinyl-diaminopimelate desuccinylase-like protein
MGHKPLSLESLQEIFEEIRDHLEQLADRIEYLIDHQHSSPVHPYDSDIDDD